MPTRMLLGLVAAGLVACSEQAPESPAAPPTDGRPQAEETGSAAPPPAPAVTRHPAPAGAMAYIIEPQDGAVVTSPVRVVFGLKGMGVAPAGIERADAGHHHLLIDVDVPPLDAPIPSDAQHVHFGGGQTETLLMLEPGRHTLRLLLGDHLHVPHDPPVLSAPVTIEVQ
ncbi:MAG TPA: DUF4399 domain-containing protein [Gammaproteobacteria bacterium]